MDKKDTTIEEKKTAEQQPVKEQPAKEEPVKEQDKKEKKKKTFSGKLFCPNCGFEVRISEKMFKDHGGQMPICPCGTHLALDCTEDPIEDDEN